MKRCRIFSSIMGTGGPLLLAVVFALPGWTQSGALDSGEMKGFTKSPTEHIIERLDQQAPLRAIEGVVVSKSLSKPISGALIEIRGPSPSDNIRSVVSGRSGQFKFKNVPKGDYAIKITSNGLRSVLGKVSVQPSAKRSKPLRIEMLHGV